MSDSVILKALLSQSFTPQFIVAIFIDTLYRHYFINVILFYIVVLKTGSIIFHKAQEKRFQRFDFCGFDESDIENINFTVVPHVNLKIS